ncbi:MAG: Asp-tRNA(Asn)/Glu-tRNA(Gln) amidotransferase subunit GatB [Bacteroidota bacterium]
MALQAPYDQYELVIGLEVHVQLATKSKAFCADDTTFGAAPNTHVSAISLGHPGTLPRLNTQQVAFAVRLGLALGSSINEYSTFDRKNYFYADLPKGYQITQDASPICVGGQFPVAVAGKVKHIRMHHIHMEEDAGKSIHDQGTNYSLIDLNRAGVPLLEVVTEPDFRSAEEVDAFMTGMRQLVRYLEISDGNMEQGSMRCDCNVSVRPFGQKEFGERCEIKNLNSMRYARKAIAYEFKRQIDLIESGEKVIQQTLNFDPETGITSPLRSKEDAHDYRYFPEPDLPPVQLSKDRIEAIKSAMPALPWVLKQQFQAQFGLSEYDANLLTEEKETARFFQGLAQATDNHKAAANLIINKITPYCQEQKLTISAFPIPPKALAAFIELIDSGKVSSSIAYQRIFPELVEHSTEAPQAIAQRLNLIQSSDSSFLEELVDQAMAKFPDKVAAYRKGKKGLIGFFMGEVMRNSQGKAEPKATNALLRKKLEQK